MLTQYNKEAESFLSRIVTSDETWIHYYRLECKSVSVVWKTAYKTAPLKFKEKLSVGTVLASVVPKGYTHIRHILSENFRII